MICNKNVFIQESKKKQMQNNIQFILICNIPLILQYFFLS